MPLWISSISYAYFLLLLFKCLLQLLRHFLIVHEKKIFPFLRLTLKSSCSICTIFFCFMADPSLALQLFRGFPKMIWMLYHMQDIFWQHDAYFLMEWAASGHFWASAFSNLCLLLLVWSPGREGGLLSAVASAWLEGLWWSQHHQLPTERLPWAPARAKAAPPPKPPVSSDHPPNAFLNWWSMFQVHQLRRDPSAYSLNISSPNPPILNVESQHSDILGFWM